MALKLNDEVGTRQDAFVWIGVADAVPPLLEADSRKVETYTVPPGSAGEENLMEQFRDVVRINTRTGVGHVHFRADPVEQDLPFLSKGDPIKRVVDQVDEDREDSMRIVNYSHRSEGWRNDEFDASVGDLPLKELPQIFLDGLA